MLRLHKALARLAADALRRRVRRDQLRALGLQALQLLHEAVKLGVADLRRVQHVIKVLMATDLFAQFLDRALNICRTRGHAPIILGDSFATRQVSWHDLSFVYS